MPKRASPLAVVVHYFLIGLAGTAIVVLLSVYLKINAASRALQRAEALLADGGLKQAMGELEAIRRTAELYPQLRVQSECLTVRCLARMGDLEKAELLAESILRRRLRGGGLPATVWEAIHSIPDPLVNAILAHYMADGISTRSGYEVLEQELSRAGQEEQLTALQKLVPPAVRNTASTNRADHKVPPTLSESPPEADSTPDWGIAVAARTRIYALSGKFLHTVDAGTLVVIEDVKRSSVGEMAICTAMHPGRLEAPFLVRMGEIETYRGPLSGVDPVERRLRVQRARLEVAMAKALAAPNPSNPHTRRYRAIEAEHAAYWKRVKDLQERRDAARDDEHVGLADELRRLKGEDIRLSQALEQVKRDHDNWSESHPDSMQSNPDVRRIRSQIDRIDQQLGKL